MAWYDDICWVGLVLVAPDHQRKGLGTEMVAHAMERATARSDRIRLDAKDQGHPIYRRLGFVDVSPIDRWRGAILADGPAGDAVRISEEPLEAIAAFDAEHSSVARRNLLELLLAGDDTSGYLVADDYVRGYALEIPGRDSSQLGPVVATDEEAFRSLLAAAGDALGSAPVVVDAIGRERRSAVLVEHELEVARSLSRMTYRRSRDLLADDSIHAAAGLQWG